ncbi:conserved protein, unknown function [Plasmodium gonderi]|uniref:SRAP domain-containing protein n=1 Tax=Plasmodium gonderi TaxID=77519 RepID=A0A1Y1JJS5_PLAGO|nr:conserved protein, unknown function [Plasmodium gonderi]GAW82756.1 conserved protein, unknown function [Plasmodium gonderi]
MCVRVYYNIDINILKKKYNCKQVLNNEKLRRGMINKKNYMPIIYESAGNGKENKDAEKRNVIQVCLWGLKPHNYERLNKEVLLINARLESLQSKKSFNVLINKNRCAVVVNGYFEWMEIRGSSKRIPYFVFFGKGDNSSEEITEDTVETKVEDTTEEKSEGKITPKIKEERGTTIRIRVKKELEVGENIKGRPKKDEKKKVKEEEEAESQSNEEELALTDKGTPKRKKEVVEKGIKKKIKTETSSEDLEEEDEEEKSHVIIAGLYRISKVDKKDCRYTIITTECENSTLRDINERCPLLLSENTIRLWLDVKKKYEDIIESVIEEHQAIYKLKAGPIMHLNQKGQKRLLRMNVKDKKGNESTILEHCVHLGNL